MKTTLVHHLSGREDAALETLQDAIEKGWRHYYLQGGDLKFPSAAGEGDAAYMESIRLLEADISAMRQSVSANGWAETPEEFFAHDQIIVTGAK